MNRQEAYNAMKEGYKVTHTSFTSNEFLHFVDEQVFTEDNYYFEDVFFEQEWFENGWSVYGGYANKNNAYYKISNVFDDSVVFEYQPQIYQPKPWYNQFGYKRQIYKSK